jgi:uncharacterized ion transporter superfamily protein YfcC
LFFLFINILEFFIGSGTAKAFLVMPLVLPLADMLLVSRQSITSLLFSCGWFLQHILSDKRRYDSGNWSCQCILR